MPESWSVPINKHGEQETVTSCSAGKRDSCSAAPLEAGECCGTQNVHITRSHFGTLLHIKNVKSSLNQSDIGVYW